MASNSEHNPASQDEFRSSTPDLTPNLESPPADTYPFEFREPHNDVGLENKQNLDNLRMDQELLERQRSIEEEYQAIGVLKDKLEQRLREGQLTSRWRLDNIAIAKALIPLLESHADSIKFIYEEPRQHDEEQAGWVDDTSDRIEGRIEKGKEQAKQHYHEHEEAFKNQATMDYTRAREANPDQYPQPLDYPPYTNNIDQEPSNEGQDR